MKRTIVILLIVGLGALVVYLLPHNSGELAVVTLEEGIFESDPVVRQLEKLSKDAAVKAVVLRIDSPGGSVGAAQEIHDAVKDLARVKKVVASFGSVAASGGYYVALPAHKIIANPGTVTGSIGVRMEYLYAGELIQWAKLKAETLKSGYWKDAGSPSREMTPEERVYLEEILKKLHTQFKRAVAEARSLPAERVDSLAEGQLFTGEEAKALGLVDELGNLQAGIRLAAQLAGIKEEPKVFYPERDYDHWLERVLGQASTRLLRIGLGDLPRWQFQYR